MSELKHMKSKLCRQNIKLQQEGGENREKMDSLQYGFVISSFARGEVLGLHHESLGIHFTGKRLDFTLQKKYKDYCIVLLVSCIY